VPKIFQNGKYDNFYFLRFNAPVAGWYFDTLEAHHAFLAELPKNLGYIAAFYLRDIAFWKDEAQTGNLEDLYRYNAKDCWATALVFLTWLKEAPDWALINYTIKFPLVSACLATEVDGLLLDMERLTQETEIQKQKLSKNLLSLQKKLGIPSFNPSSPKQVLQLLHLLGAKDLTSSDEKNLERAADKHPINRFLVDEILAFREARKLISTYLEAELWNGKLFYTLNPSGTDTGRLASRESQLWCGTQLQNLPGYYKQCLWAEEGYFLGEGDNEKSETHCVANLSGDGNLLRVVSDQRDFHCTNASAFFGIPYQVVFEEALRAKETNTENQTKRYLAKRIGHGANYNMGPAVLLATMGTKTAIEAGRLLSLKTKKPIEICAYLLQTYEKAYPQVKGDWYESIVASVKLTRMLVSQLGWTRLCFGSPWNSKPDLNSYVAHVPSNLSVAIINEAFVEIFHKLHLRCNGDFRLKGQVHDSLLFAYKDTREDLAQEVRAIMTKPKLIKDCKGKSRWMTIPVALKGRDRRWSQLKTIPKE
jgi:DNA polymerase I-like protein with 3'-5' exonuclease and polymerase domains